MRARNNYNTIMCDFSVFLLACCCVKRPSVKPDVEVIRMSSAQTTRTDVSQSWSISFVCLIGNRMQPLALSSAERWWTERFSNKRVTKVLYGVGQTTASFSTNFNSTVYVNLSRKYQIFISGEKYISVIEQVALLDRLMPPANLYFCNNQLSITTE
jgi:hypothetical protein